MLRVYGLFSFVLALLHISRAGAESCILSAPAVINPSTFASACVTVTNPIIPGLLGDKQFTPMVCGNSIHMQQNYGQNVGNAVWIKVPTCVPEVFYMRYTFKFQAPKYYTGADGIAAVLQTDGLGSVGDSGDSLGVENLYGRGNIRNVFAVESRIYPWTSSAGVSLYFNKTEKPAGVGRTTVKNSLFATGWDYTVELVSSWTSQNVTVYNTTSGEVLLTFAGSKNITSLVKNGNVYFGVTSSIGGNSANIILKEASFGVAAPGTRVSSQDDFVAALSRKDQKIILAPGTYTPPNNQGFLINTPSTSIYSEIAGAAVIDCGSGSDSFGINAAAANIYVKGITIKNCASAVYVTSSNATFDAVTTTMNHNTIQYGTGFHIMVNGLANIINSNVSNNQGFFGIYAYGTVNVRNTLVAMNNGGGIRASYDGKANVANTQIVGNIGSGIFATKGGMFNIDSCNISSNVQAYTGGGIGLSESSAKISNSFITYNSATMNGGGIYVEGSASHSFEVTNTIVAYNSAPNGATADVYFQDGVNAKFTSTTLSTGASDSSKTYCCGGTQKSSGITNESCNFPGTPCP